MKKCLSFIFKFTQDYIRYSEEEIQSNIPILNDFFNSISNIYIPFLWMLEKFEKDNIPCKIGLVFPPVLCSMLSSKTLQEMYLQYLDKCIALGELELKRNSSDKNVKKNVTEILENYKQIKHDYEEKYSRKLIPAFLNFMRKGMIEILGTCGTDIFLPHYADLGAVVSAQIESGLYSYRKYFGQIPEGFWLPEKGYCEGLERFIKPYGYTYTVLDSRSFMLSSKVPSSGIFCPVRASNSLALFADDGEVDEELYGENGIVYSDCFRNEKRDIGFDLPNEKLEVVLDKSQSRFATGYKYWNRKFNDEKNCVYNSEEAEGLVQKAAEEFLDKRIERLSGAQKHLNGKNSISILCTFDARQMLGNWHEGFSFFDSLIRLADKKACDIEFCSNLFEKPYELEKAYPYYSAGIGAGYGENLISSRNCWMIRYVRKASERMVDLVDRFPNDTGLKTRLLNLGAKELMIAQSANLAKMIDSNVFPEFAKKRFTESIEAFTEVFDSLGSNVVSTEWLTKTEVKDNIFSWMNYRIFAVKK